MKGTNVKEKITVSLPTDMIDWLDGSVTTQSLPNRSKAVRCCINCVAVGDVSRKAISTNQDDDDDCDNTVRAIEIELAPEQLEWIDFEITKKREIRNNRMKQIPSTSQSEIIRSVVAACREADATTVFGVIRCKTKVSKCEGSREAIACLKEQYGNGNVEVKEEIKLV